MEANLNCSALPYDMMSFNENEIHHGIFKTSLARPKKLIFVILLASECRAAFILQKKEKLSVMIKENLP